MLDRYGIKDVKEASYARNCLLARRLIERGVRFVQLFHEAWDQHGNLTKAIKQNAADTDQASAALVADLKRRGLLDDTLVIWGGEFGRTPMVQGGNDGRDHHNRCFTIWLAGGGVEGRTCPRQTDEFGLQRRRRPRARSRSECHVAAPVGPGPLATDLPLPGPRLPPDRRSRPPGRRYLGVALFPI